jgi:hypothetical protein
MKCTHQSRITVHPEVTKSGVPNHTDNHFLSYRTRIYKFSLSSLFNINNDIMQLTFSKYKLSFAFIFSIDWQTFATSMN